MVWVMRKPGGIGDFFPLGDFVDWNSDLNREARVKIVDGERYSYSLSDKFIYERGLQFSSNFVPICPIEQDEVPKQYKLDGKHTSLGSLIEFNNQIPGVDEELKNIIERLEPGVHDFYPITITMPKGAVYPKQYYILVIGQYLESFSIDKSREFIDRDAELRKLDAFSDQGGGKYSFSFHSKKYLNALTFSKAAIGKAHLWTERKLQRPEIILSDALHDEIAKAGLRLPKHVQAREI